MTEPIQETLAALADLVDKLAPPVPPRAASQEKLQWLELDPQIEGQVVDRRVLVIGTEVAEDAQAFAARGAAHVLACVSPPDEGEPHELEIEGPNIERCLLAWHMLAPDVHGSFDLVLCNGLLHRVMEPLTLLRTLRSMTTDGGTLLIGSVMIDDPERSEYLRFVPDRYAGDPSWWFVPGRLAFRWLLQAAGFEVEAEFAESEGPRDLFPIVTGYLRAIAR